MITISFRAVVIKMAGKGGDEMVRSSVELDDEATDKAKKSAITKALKKLRTELDTLLFSKE